jgi:ABC-2 type transport system ATP-binding protein
MSVVVRTEGLSKDFFSGFWRPRPHRALDGVSFEVPAGVVFGLLGPNGAGKSTTLKLLMDLLRPTSGRIELLGRPAGDVQARQRIGFLPENPQFYDHLTAEELVAYFAGLFGLAGEERRHRVRSTLDRVGLGGDRSRPLRQFSKGMLQRVGLAQALVNDPDLVILDEPMSGLDPIGRRDVRQMILDLRDQGRTVIFSSHILTDAELLCSQVAILARGHLRARGSLTELTSEGGGSEVVVTSLAPGAVSRLSPGVRRVTRIDAGRYSLELGPDVRPEMVIAELASAGASLVSVTPLRTTLEDVFLQALAAPQDAQPDAGSMAVASH